MEWTTQIMSVHELETFQQIPSVVQHNNGTPVYNHVSSNDSSKVFVAFSKFCGDAAGDVLFFLDLYMP